MKLKDKQSIVVAGMSWIGSAKHGTMCRERNDAHADLKSLYRALREDGSIREAFKNFSRQDEDSKRVCLAAGLALHDAGIEVSDNDLEIGVLISGPGGAESSNLCYFEDYVREGRKLGRANLFIYTLPTSPAAEAAIHFGLTGPLLYAGRTDQTAEASLSETSDLLRAGHADVMLCTILSEERVTCVVIGNVQVCRKQASIEEAAEAIMRLSDDDTRGA